MFRNLGALLLAGAFLLPTAGCNCGGDPAAGNPDADSPAGEDAASRDPVDGSVSKVDGGRVTGNDAALVPGADTGTTNPGLDAATTQPGPDASTTQPGLDASTAQPGLDATTVPPGPDAAAPAGPDAATPAGPDAATPPGPDAGNPGAVIVDLRADVNRNGTVDLTDPTEDLNEDTWDATHGAIFLANIDDDQDACTWNDYTSDAVLARCNDAYDEVINGADDLLDLARLKTVPWPGAPADAVGTIAVSTTNARLFVNQGSGSFVVFAPATGRLSAAQLRAGVELAIEAKDVVRNSALWDGTCDVTLTVTGTGVPANTSDKVRLRVAPLVTRHHLHPPQRVYYTPISGDSGSTAFKNNLQSALTSAGITEPLFPLDFEDQWTQDILETTYMSMPAVGSPHVIHVNVRSANQSRDGYYTLRTAGRAVFTQLRGKDVGGVQQYTSHTSAMDTLDSFGNLETIPPYTWNGRTYPLGRIYRGNVPTWHPDSSMVTMFESQKVQPPLYVDTSFLTVGHVDETVTFLKANNTRGWTIAVADPTLAKTMFEQEETNGNGDVVVFQGMKWDAYTSAQTTITEVLDDTVVTAASAHAAAGIAAQIAILQGEIGLTDAEILHFPVFFQKASNRDVAYSPDTINGISLGDAHFGLANPHGPVIGGADLFKTQITQQFQLLSPATIAPHWVENWNLYHRNLGGVHCGSNTTRQVPATERWWESGR
ncbi:MAG: protein-arginine deiminase family protein [Myxococcales bacterium]